jgi:glycosyltransferase involved in cell wall biosynthesis
LKIAICCPASLPATQFGGILFLGADLAREFSEKGNDVTIYTSDLDFANNPKTFNRNLPDKEKFDNFFIKRTHVYLSIFLFYVNPGMYFQMKKDDMDIIHTIGVRSFQSIIAALISKRKKIPLVVSDQGGLTTHPDLKNSNPFKKFIYKIQIPMIKFVLNQATRIIAANEYEKTIFSTFGVEEKVYIVKNGINLHNTNNVKIDFKKKYSINKKYFLFLGRFSKVKGIDLLIQALNHIKNEKELKDYQLVLMGVDFGFQREMLSMISSFNLQEKIIVIKNPPRDDVLAAYRESEFLVLPSRWELSPLTPLEGFMFGKPTISTTAHGIPHTIKDNENCLLVEPENFKKLGDAINKLVKDEELTKRLGSEGKKLVNEVCNSQKMASEITVQYEAILRL